MRLPHGYIAGALALLAAACGPGKNQPPPAGGGYIYPVKDSPGQTKTAKQKDAAMPWVSSEPLPDFDSSGSGDRTVFIARVDKEGLIHLGGSIVTEEKYLEEAGKALHVVPGVTAVLLVESGITQGIHLSAELSGLGYKNVQIYYPTATNNENIK
jgi:hypothetical protein